MPTIRRRSTAEFSRIPLPDEIPATKRKEHNGPATLSLSPHVAEFVRILQAKRSQADRMPTSRRRSTAEFSRIPLPDEIPATKRKEHNGPATLSLSPHVAEFVRILQAKRSQADRMPTSRRRSTAEFSRIPLPDEIPATKRKEHNGPATLSLSPHVAEFVRILPSQTEQADRMPTSRRRSTAEFSRIPLPDEIPATESRAQLFPAPCPIPVGCLDPGSDFRGP